MFNLCLIINETAAAAQPWPAALPGAEVGAGASGRTPLHLPPEGCLGGQRGQGQRGQGPAACGVALLSPASSCFLPGGSGGCDALVRAAETSTLSDTGAGVRCPSHVQVAEYGLRPTGRDEKKGFLCCEHRIAAAHHRGGARPHFGNGLVVLNLSLCPRVFGSACVGV